MIMEQRKNEMINLLSDENSPLFQMVDKLNDGRMADLMSKFDNRLKFDFDYFKTGGARKEVDLFGKMLACTEFYLEDEARHNSKAAQVWETRVKEYCDKHKLALCMLALEETNLFGREETAMSKSDLEEEVALVETVLEKRGINVNAIEAMDKNELKSLIDRGSKLSDINELMAGTLDGQINERDVNKEEVAKILEELTNEKEGITPSTDDMDR